MPLLLAGARWTALLDGAVVRVTEVWAGSRGQAAPVVSRCFREVGGDGSEGQNRICSVASRQTSQIP